MNKITIQCTNIKKSFKSGDETFVALKNINLVAHENEMMMIMGPSGSGKSTFLSVISGLLKQDSGECTILGESINDLSEKDKTAFRGKNIGFMFQQTKLIPTLTVVENVAIPLLLKNIPRSQALEQAAELLKSFDIIKDLNKFPTSLSGGEQQRVAIARACIHHPKIMLCDEPTSFLDSERGQKIMNLLKKIKEEEKATIIIVTHDPRILSFADKIMVIEDGQIKDGDKNAAQKLLM